MQCVEIQVTERRYYLTCTSNREEVLPHL
uniref:Uncharacterized protein n=1 Tax=Anguilla anguilla TaxID=7936 RepID=A0A0E9TR39_ANGAN